MNEEKPKLEPQKENTPQIINLQNENNPNKIIIENEPSEFEKPEEIKNLSQEISPPLITPNTSSIVQNPTQNIDINIPPNTNENQSTNINISIQNNINSNLTLNINSEQSYNPSYSNEVSSYTPSGKKLEENINVKKKIVIKFFMINVL